MDFLICQWLIMQMDWNVGSFGIVKTQEKKLLPSQ